MVTAKAKKEIRNQGGKATKSNRRKAPDESGVTRAASDEASHRADDATGDASGAALAAPAVPAAPDAGVATAAAAWAVSGVERLRYLATHYRLTGHEPAELCAHNGFVASAAHMPQVLPRHPMERPVEWRL